MARTALFITQILDGQIVGSSTTELVSVGLNKGFCVWVADPKTVSKEAGLPVRAVCHNVIKANVKTASLRHSCDLGNGITKNVEEYDVVFMRIQPPVNNEYYVICSLLSELPDRIIKINNPSGIINVQEKIMPLAFPDIHPPTLVSQDINQIMDFAKEYNELVVKPLNNYQGIDVSRTSRQDAYRVITALLDKYNTPVVIQVYLSKVSLGDKRIFLLDGIPIAAVNRIPKKNSFIASLHAGSKAEITKITDRDIEITQKIYPLLHNNGLVFVGLDVIGGYLTEIGTTSPTGMVQHRLLEGWSIAEPVWEWVIEQLNHSIDTDSTAPSWNL